MGFAALVLAAGPGLCQPISPERLAEVLHRSPVPVVVNVWATWCRPCVEEFPEILAFAREQGSRIKLVLLSADFSSRRELVDAFLRQHGVDVVTFLKDGADEAFINVLSPQWTGSLPATFVFAPGGKLVAFFERKITKSELEQALASLPKSPPKGGKP
ncbi:MAG: TlpA family protein disulfide reductase [Thermoanaerobaculum sp.]